MKSEITPKILIVEGENDKKLIDQILKKHQLSYLTKIFIPKDINTSVTNGKSGVIRQLKQLISKKREYTNLAAIVDTDYKCDGQTIENVLNPFFNDIKQYGYDKIEKLSNTGYYFSATDKKLPKVGIWFMPNNHDEGAIEKWLLNIANDDEKELIEYVKNVCENVPIKKFREPQDSHKAQLEVYKIFMVTRLWATVQKSPTLGTESIILHNLYDENSNDFQNFISWLKFIYE